jgi:hypothetical protein
VAAIARRACLAEWHGDKPSAATGNVAGGKRQADACDPGGLPSGASSVGWVRSFYRTTLQPIGKAALSSGADFGVDPSLGADRTSSDNDGLGHWVDRDDGRGV